MLISVRTVWEIVFENLELFVHVSDFLRIMYQLEVEMGILLLLVRSWDYEKKLNNCINPFGHIHVALFGHRNTHVTFLLLKRLLVPHMSPFVGFILSY